MDHGTIAWWTLLALAAFLGGVALAAPQKHIEVMAFIVVAMVLASTFIWYAAIPDQQRDRAFIFSGCWFVAGVAAALAARRRRKRRQ